MFILSISYILEEERLTRHRLPCLSTTFSLNHISEVIKGHSTPSHLDECSHDSTHHIPQDTIGSYLEIPEIRRRLVPGSNGHFAKCRLRIRMTITEGGEIVISDQHFCCLVHSCKDKRIVEHATIGSSERVFPRMNIIAIHSRGC